MLIKSVLFLQSCFSDRKKASNLEAYVEWFNRLSYLVATEICMVSHGGGLEPWRWLKLTTQLCIKTCWMRSDFYAL